MKETKVTDYDQLAAAIDRGDTVYMYNAGPMGNDKIRVIDYMVSSNAYPDQEWLDEEGFANEMEWLQAYQGTRAIVLAKPMGQGGTNTRILDSVNVEDFDIYIVEKAKQFTERKKGHITPLSKYFKGLFPWYNPGEIGEVVFTGDEMFGDLERKGLTGYGTWVGYQHDMQGSPSREYFMHLTDVVYDEVLPAFKDFVTNELGGDPDKIVIENRRHDTDMYRMYYIEDKQGKRVSESRIMSQSHKEGDSQSSTRAGLFDMNKVLKSIRGTMDEVHYIYFSWESLLEDERRIKIELRNGYTVYADEKKEGKNGKPVIRTVLVGKGMDYDFIDIFEATSEDEAIDDIKEAIDIAYNGDSKIR